MPTTPSASTLPTLPFTGVVVLDLTQIYNGPYATFLMAQAGATVIKIEPPGGGHLRKRDRSKGVTEPFAMLNANKRCITLDLKCSAGVALLLEMAVGADVIVQNFAPGVMDRLGLDEATLRRANPALIIASGSGYGSTGPYRDYPAMDLTVQAMSGVMAVTGNAGEPPVKAGPAVCDFFGGIHLYGAIVTALYRRATTGEAATVEVSMMSSVFPSLLSNLGMATRGAKTTARTGNRHGGLTMSPYNVYPTSDGAIAILSVSEPHWRAIASVLGHSEWCDDARFANKTARIRHMEEVDAMIGRETVQYGKAELFERLVRARVPCAPVRELPEVINDPHLHESGMLKWRDHPEFGEVLTHGSPLEFKGEKPAAYRPSSRLGADTQEVLGGMFGLDAARIAALGRQGAFAAEAAGSQHVD